MSTLPHIVVIGGGFGGLAAAHALRDAPVRVTLLDRHNYHLFQPLLYQVATASLSPGDIAAPIRWILRRQRNARVLLAEARAIDVVGRRVLLDQSPAHTTSSDRPVSHREGSSDEGVEAVSFDFLIVATGAAHAYFGHPEWARRAPGLKTLDDALEIRRRVLIAFEAAERESDPTVQRRLLTFVIVGGGPTGVELAGALAEIAGRTLRDDFRRIRPESARIVLLEGSPQMLGAFPEPLGERARRALARLGVEVRTNALVTAVNEDGVAWRATSGESHEPDHLIAAQTVLWAAGVAASPLAASLGVPLDRAGRVRAEATLAVPGHPDVFVVGDLCALQHDGKPLPGVAQVAKQEGTHAAQNALRVIRGEPPQPFRYRDYGSMATIGRGSAVAAIDGIKLAGLLAWLIWLFVHILWLVGFRNRLAVLSEWAWAYVTFQRRVRLITGGHLWPGP